MSQENVEVVRRGYEAFVQRDMEAIEAIGQEHLAPDFEFESVLTGQVYRGAEGTRELAADLWDTLDYMAAPEEIIDAGEHVLIVLRISGRGTRSGVPVAQQVAVVWTFAGDRIVRGQSFTSRSEAVAAVGLRE
jgi:ketosteroid isomerase-like protein